MRIILNPLRTAGRQGLENGNENHSQPRSGYDVRYQPSSHKGLAPLLLPLPPGQAQPATLAPCAPGGRPGRGHGGAPARIAKRYPTQLGDPKLQGFARTPGVVQSSIGPCVGF